MPEPGDGEHTTPTRPDLFFDDALIARVDEEVMSLSFRGDELDFMAAVNPGLYDAVMTIYRNTRDEGGERASDQCMAGMLYAHRLMRYAAASGSYPMQRISKADYSERAFKVLPELNQDSESPRVRAILTDQAPLARRLDEFTNPNSQGGAGAMLLLHIDLVTLPISANAETSETEAAAV